MRWFTTLAICLGVGLVAAGLTWWIYATEPAAQRSGATRETAMLVSVTRPGHGSFAPRITALGTVRAARDIDLAPRVAGQVIERAPAFTPGGIVAAGTDLLRIDPADYRIALAQAESDLQQAQADLALERGQQYVAQQDYQAFGESLPDERQALALRRPQLKAAEARVAAAEAAVRRAELDLERTLVTAPFDALVLSRTAEVGSQVDAGTPIARLVGIDSWWVEATVPLHKLPFIELPDTAAAALSGGTAADSTGGSDRRAAAETIDESDDTQVVIRHRSAWPDGASRSGRIHRLIGALNQTTRLARLLIEVPDPLARETGEAPRLVIDAVVEATIPGRRLQDVIRLDRRLLRSGDTVWTMTAEDQLAIHEVEVLFRDQQHVYINAGLPADARVVATDLATIVEGSPLRLQGADDDRESRDESGSAGDGS